MIITRELLPTDANYVIQCWLRSAYHNKLDNLHKMDRGEYDLFYRNHIVKTLLDSNTLIACTDSSPDAILGFLVYQYTKAPIRSLVIHYAYTPSTAQRKGIATLLTRTAQQTTEGDTILTTMYSPHLRHIKELSYNPYLIDLTK